MPLVEFYQNKSTGDVMMCSFVFCKELGGGNAATGPLTHIPKDEFERNAANIVAREFELFYTREYGIKSALYNEMKQSEQQKFFSEHAKVIVSLPTSKDHVNIYVGQEGTFYGRIDIPHDKSSFANVIFAAFASVS